jgi:hypothetical protein
LRNMWIIPNTELRDCASIVGSGGRYSQFNLAIEGGPEEPTS